VNFTGNTVHDSARGIRIEDDGYGFGDNSDLHINGNAITGNATYGINVVGGYTGTLDAECNWYGDASGPTAAGNPSGTGDSVIGDVDFVPWRLSSSLSGDCSGDDVAVDSAAGDANGNEGDTLTASGSFSGDVASITADNLIGTFVDNNNGSWSWSYTPTDDFSTVTISVTAHGTNGSEASDSFDTSAANVDPTAAGLLAPASAAATHSFNISLDAPTDASSVDASALHYAFDCGTGYGTAVDYASSGTSNGASCIALLQAHSGDLQTVKAKVFDKDGGSAEYTADVAILQPEILLDPSDYDFGDVVTGGIASKTFTVTNVGDSTLNITGVGIHGVNPFYFDIDTNNCYEAALAPAGTCTIIVVFDPNYTGPRTATLDVTSNDPNVATATATLAGNGVAPTTPDAALTPASHDFGQVKIAETIGLSGSLVSTLSSALLMPFPIGLKVTSMSQLELAASVLPHVVDPSVNHAGDAPPR
jgi:hypothetical protein